MAKLIKLEATKTYATWENAIKAVEQRYAGTDLRYFVAKTDEGRFFPVFVGEPAIQAGVHFHFNVVG